MPIGIFKFLSIEGSQTKKLQNKRQIVFATLFFFIHIVTILSIFPTDVYSQDFQAIDFSYKVKTLNDLSEEKIAYAQGRQEIEKSVDKLYEYLKKENPKLFSDRKLSEIIINESNKAKADYRIVVAIMANESGFCRIPYLSFNCFGYLNKVQYKDFTHAFKEITPQVARIVAVSNWDTFSLASRYGAVNKQIWALKIKNIAQRI